MRRKYTYQCLASLSGWPPVQRCLLIKICWWCWCDHSLIPPATSLGCCIFGFTAAGLVKNTRKLMWSVPRELHHVEFGRPWSNLWTKFWMIQKAMGAMVDNRLSLYDSCFKRSFWLLCGQMHSKWCKTELGNYSVLHQSNFHWVLWKGLAFLVYLNSL